MAMNIIPIDTIFLKQIVTAYFHTFSYNIFMITVTSDMAPYTPNLWNRETSLNNKKKFMHEVIMAQQEVMFHGHKNTSKSLVMSRKSNVVILFRFTKIFLAYFLRLIVWSTHRTSCLKRKRFWLVLYRCRFEPRPVYRLSLDFLSLSRRFPGCYL
jgi:hypothetical protein